MAAVRERLPGPHLESKCIVDLVAGCGRVVGRIDLHDPFLAILHHQLETIFLHGSQVRTSCDTRDLGLAGMRQLDRHIATYRSRPEDANLHRLKTKFLVQPDPLELARGTLGNFF